ncbi:MAG: diguanylate cyclase [Gammaproteobacteria bacterium]|jgi:diguanylate cyclase|nr:diguanylate cyclase [Gammaproteobacteria bacterium]
MEPALRQLADAVARTETLEDLVRPLLEILEVVSGLESTYLTAIDLDRWHQRILFSRNTRDLTIPEGLEVPWGDTLCKRALEGDCAHSEDVEADWGDSEAARELGIKSYVSEPVKVGNGELFGTLCGASGGAVPLSQDTERLLSLFASLIARQIERDRLIAYLREQNRDYMSFALTDPLTGIPNRRALLRELDRVLSDDERPSGDIHVAFIDLDEFKAINDRFGHDAGDRFLLEMSRVLSEGLRKTDMLARFGGDEFVVVGADEHAGGGRTREAWAARLAKLTSGRFDIGMSTIDYAGPSIGVITVHPEEQNAEQVISRADAVMYGVKKRRRAEGRPARFTSSQRL